jgi:hypothetical protein
MRVLLGTSNRSRVQRARFQKAAGANFSFYPKRGWRQLNILLIQRVPGEKLPDPDFHHSHRYRTEIKKFRGHTLVAGYIF